MVLTPEQERNLKEKVQDRNEGRREQEQKNKNDKMTRKLFDEFKGTKASAKQKVSTAASRFKSGRERAGSFRKSLGNQSGLGASFLSAAEKTERARDVFRRNFGEVNDLGLETGGGMFSEPDTRTGLLGETVDRSSRTFGVEFDGNEGGIGDGLGVEMDFDSGSSDSDFDLEVF